MAILDVVQKRGSFTATGVKKPELRATPTFRAVGLGPFDEVEIRQRPVTVLIGKNSVGKSLLMTAMWLFAYPPPGSISVNDDLVKKFDERRDEATLRELVINAAENYLKAMAKGIYEASHQITALNGSRLELTSASGRSLEIEITENGVSIRKDDITPLFSQVEVVKDGPKFRVTLGDNVVMVTDHLADLIADTIRFVHLVYYHELYPWHGLYGPPLFAPYFLVDGRSGLIKVAKPWARFEIGVVDSEFLRSYYMLSELVRRLVPSDAFQNFAKELGVEKVEAVVEGGYYRLYVELWDGVKMPIEKAPSGVREALLPAIALETIRDNIMFIEEPEAHLHPAAIVMFVQLLTHAVNTRGAWVVLSTHSDFLLSKLSNLVEASTLDEERLKRLGLAKELALPRDKIAVYLVRADRERKRSVVEEVPVDEEGLAELEFSKVSEELLNESSYISLLKS